jgi:hypothetical protein
MGVIVKYFILCGLAAKKVAGADNITAAKKATMLKSGMQFHQEISVPVKGDYYIRAGIHDRVNDAMGAVEMDVNVKAGAEKAAAALAKAAAGVPPLRPPLQSLALHR